MTPEQHEEYTTEPEKHIKSSEAKARFEQEKQAHFEQEKHVLSSEALRAKIEALQTQLNTDMAAEGLTAADLGFVDDVKPGAVHWLKPGESPLSVTPDLLRIGQLEKAAEVFGQEIVRLTTERDKYSAALREIIQDPVPNLTHVKIAKAALGW